jgi:hypothetical protein
MLMTKDEIKNLVMWPANVRAPLDRNTQIAFMKTARRKHLAVLETPKKGNKNVVD